MTNPIFTLANIMRRAGEASGVAQRGLLDAATFGLNDRVLAASNAFRDKMRGAPETFDDLNRRYFHAAKARDAEDEALNPAARRIGTLDGVLPTVEGEPGSYRFRFFKR